jgi:hypothetical protein
MLEGLSLVGRHNFRAVKLPMNYVVVVVKAVSATSVLRRSSVTSIRLKSSCSSHLSRSSGTLVLNFFCTMGFGFELLIVYSSAFSHMLAADVLRIFFPRLKNNISQ